MGTALCRIEDTPQWQGFIARDLLRLVFRFQYEHEVLEAVREIARRMDPPVPGNAFIYVWPEPE